MARRTIVKRLLKTEERTDSSRTRYKTSNRCCKPDACPTAGQLMSTKRLGFEFFNRSCLDVASSMLGKLMVRRLSDETGAEKELVVRVVETEAYLGVIDRASHSYNGRKTARNTAMFMNPGTAYVYNIYGMYQCINISTLEEGSAVLIRAAEPIAGLDEMIRARSTNRARSSALKTKDLCSGPSKLCQALSITKQAFDQHDLTTSLKLYLAEDGFSTTTDDIVACPRIGIEYASEWAKKPWRFYLRENPFVSVKLVPRVHTAK
ncbi:unnamed protein product [Soboliphyme baturini]|uniref:DNA-3-methyladenine glycosylase n=1 Tax=Soboliphyme baturini TaxID=241478 RepID=A0A183ICZ5_9BILA|nr:unnamed protein product [Soboliphyme baturini]